MSCTDDSHVEMPRVPRRQMTSHPNGSSPYWWYGPLAGRRYLPLLPLPPKPWTSTFPHPDLHLSRQH